MSAPTVPDTCPRCDTHDVSLLTGSPVPGRWFMYTCGVCFYSWRSTEPAYATDPHSYPAAFKIDPAAIPEMPVVPTIPTRRG